MSKDNLRTLSANSRDLLDPAGYFTFKEKPEEQAAAEAPAVPEPTTMPIPDDEEIKKKKRRSIAEQRQRQGRASTFMSTNDALGGV